MPAPFFIGDEVTAAGYRLAGARTLVPAPDEMPAAFTAALEQAEIVFITAASAEYLDGKRLDAAIRRADPLILVVPDAAGRTAPPDTGASVDRVLGIET